MKIIIFNLTLIYLKGEKLQICLNIVYSIYYLGKYTVIRYSFECHFIYWWMQFSKIHQYITKIINKQIKRIEKYSYFFFSFMNRDLFIRNTKLLRKVLYTTWKKLISFKTMEQLFLFFLIWILKFYSCMCIWY